MIIKPESNNHKILLALVEANKSLSVKILAENTGIPYKNIHRNITQLFDGEFIAKLVSQESRSRYTYISLTSKGSDFKAYLEIKTLKKMTRSAPEIEKIPNYFAPESYGESLKFGIRFFSWFARELEIPNYSSLRLHMLKLKIGLQLIKESDLVISGKMMNKYLD